MSGGGGECDGSAGARRRVRQLASALLEAAVGAGGGGAAPGGGAAGGSELSPFACPSCEGVLVSPVTLACGHSLCRVCTAREAGRPCRRCGLRLPAPAAPRDANANVNVLVQALTEKWWPAELAAARLRDQGNQLFARRDVAAALRKYDDALVIAPHNHLVLSNRSHALLRLHRLPEALADADAVVRLRPAWPKGHYRRGAALSALGRHEEALLSLCACAALEGSAAGVRREATRSLGYLLLLSAAHAHPGQHPPHFPLGCIPGRQLKTEGSLRARCQAQPRRVAQTHRHQHRHQHPASSDCEDSSSGEDDDSCQPAQQFSSGTVMFLQENSILNKLTQRVFNQIEKLKRSEVHGNADLNVDQQLVEPAEFECVLCCRILWQPVTTPCGHTYCWMCLDRCLDYSCACPLCMTSLADYLATSPRSITEFVECALRLLLPAEYAARQALHRQELVGGGPHVPVFVCTTAFPCVPCPLYVYEPRYRVMVRRCVDSGSRQFGIAACLHKDAGRDRYAEYGTMLEIRDWILLKDGCSILTTVGVRRFRVLARGERDGYDTAQVEFLRDQPVMPEHLGRLQELHERVRQKGQQWFAAMPPQVQAEIIRTFGHMPAVEEDWPTLADGPAWPWWLLAILPLGQHLQVGILSTTSLEKRLRAIDKTLDQVQLRMVNVAGPSESQISTERVPNGNQQQHYNYQQQHHQHQLQQQQQQIQLLQAQQQQQQQQQQHHHHQQQQQQQQQNHHHHQQQQQQQQHHHHHHHNQHQHMQQQQYPPQRQQVHFQQQPQQQTNNGQSQPPLPMSMPSSVWHPQPMVVEPS